MRGWRLKFSGARTQSVDTFLDRLEDLRLGAGLSEEEMLYAIAEVLDGPARTWFNNNKTKWKNYQEFMTGARDWFETSTQQQQRLQQEVQNRFQGDEELARDYIANLQALMNQLYPPMGLERQLDLLHANLLPAIQIQLRRRDVRNIDDLKERATEIQNTLLYGRRSRQAQVPSSFIFPEYAYHPPNRKTNDPRVRVAALGAEDERSGTGDTGNSMTELLSEPAIPTSEGVVAIAAAKGGYQKSSVPEQLDKLSEMMKMLVQMQQQNANWAKGQPGAGGNTRVPGAVNAQGKENRRKNIDYTKPLQCSECGRLGFSKRHCPDCNPGNEELNGGTGSSPSKAL